MQSEIFIPENVKYKFLAFAVNLFLIFGLLLIPDGGMLPHMLDWYNKLDLYLTVILSIPLTWQSYMLLRRTGIALDPHGLTDNLSHLKVQKFLWSEITGIKFVRMLFLKYMLIYVADPKIHVQSKNIYQRLSLMNNFKKFGTPIKIPVHAMDKTPQEIANIISEYMQMLAKKQPQGAE